MGRLCNEPDIKYSAGENATCIANFSIAVDKRFKRKDDPNASTADFFRITAFGRLGEFCQNYLHKGTKIAMTGRIENNNYTDANGNKVYRDQIIAENIEFAESKKAADENANANFNSTPNVGIPDDVSDGSLPFK